MFYVPGDFIYNSDKLDQRIIRRFNSIIERTQSEPPQLSKAKNLPNRLKTIEISNERTKRCSLPAKIPKKIELPLIQQKRFLLKGSVAQHSPINKMSLRRLELQNKMTLIHGKMVSEKSTIKRVTERTKSDYFSILPWHYGQDIQY